LLNNKNTCIKRIAAGNLNLTVAFL